MTSIREALRRLIQRERLASTLLSGPGRSAIIGQRRAMTQRTELISWEEVGQLIEHLTPQFETEFDAMVIITRGGIVPGGMLCEALNILDVLTAAVDFPFESQKSGSALYAWPAFIQFPDEDQLRGRQVLVVDDVWGSGRTITAVKNRVSSAGGFPHTCVLHFNPYRSLFNEAKPDYYAAVTDAHVVYPWEVDRDADRVLLDAPE
ncbi:MAG TPA: phosphoribosyltransferase family protein [Anaerolineales bacterium]|nr:phosphoribosyltransferase family protein [Anaerolineales bacterium]